MPRKPPLHRQTQLHAQYAKQRDDDDPLEASSTPHFVTALHLAKERRRQDIDAARDAAAVSVGNSAAAAATTTGEPQGPLRAAAVTLFPIRECPRSISALLDEARRRRVKTLRRDLLPRDELAAREAIERTFWTDVFIASVERSVFMFRQIDGPRARSALMRRIAHELRNTDQSGEGSARLGVERLEATHRSLLEQLCTTVGATLAQQCAAAGALLQERLRLDRRIFDAAATVARALRKNAWKKQCLRSCVKNAQSIRRKDLALCVERAWQLYCNRIKGREQLRLLRHSYTRRDAIDARECGERLQISSRCFEEEHSAFACTLCSGAALPITFSHLVLSDTIPSLWEGSGGMAKLRFLYSECLGEHFAAEARAAFVATRTPLLLAAEQLQRAAIEHHWATNPVNSVAAWRAGLRLLSALRLLHLRRSRTRRWLIAELLERRTAAALLGQRLWRGCAARCRVRFLRINRDERAVRCGIEREECATWALQIGTAAVGNHQLIDLCDVQRQELEGRECVARVMCHHVVAMLDRAAAFAAFLEAVERNSRADISAARNRGAAARHLSRVAKAAVSRLFLGRLRHLLRSETEHRAFVGESLEFLQRATIVTIHETMIDESVVAQRLLLEGAVLACVFGDVVTPEVSQRRSLVRNFSETLDVMHQRRDAATQLLTRVTISLRSRRAFASWTSHQRREQRLRTNIEVDALLAAAELCFSHVAALQFEATLALRKRAWALQNDDTALRLRRLVTEEHSRRGDLEDAATRLAAVHELEAEALAAAAASKAGLQSGAHQSYEESEEVDIDSYDEEDEEGEEEDFDDEETEDYEEEDEEDEEDDVSGDADGGGERRFSVESTRSPLVPTVRTAMPNVTVTMIEDAETAARRRGIVVWAQALAKMHHTFLETMPSTSPRTSSDHDGNDSSSAASSGIDDEDGDDALSMVSASELERAAAGAAVAEAQEEPEVQPPPLSNSPTVAFLTPDAETLLAAVVSTESLCRKQLVAAEADDSLLLGVFAAELAGRARIDTAAASSQGLQNIVKIHRTLQLLNESAKNAETPDTSDVSSTSSASGSSSLSSSASSSAASTPRGVPLDAPPTAAANAAAAAVALETAEAATRAQLESLENWARATMFLEHDESVARAGLIVESTSCSAFATILLKHQTIQMYLDVDGEDLSESNSADHDDSSVSAAARDLIAQFTQQAFAELAENSADVKIRVCVPQEQVHRRHIVQRRVLDVKMMYAESVEAKARLQVERSEVAARQRLSADAPPRQALSPQPQPQLPMVETKHGPVIGGSLLEVHAQARSLLLHQFTRLILDALEATEQLQRRDALAVRTTDLKYYFAEYKSGLVRATITRQERYLRGKIHATFEAARVAIEYTDTHDPAAVRVLREHKAARDELLQLDLGWRVEALGTCEQLSRRAIAEQRILAVKCLFVQHREGAARTALQRQVYRGPAWANVLQAFSDIETAATAASVAAAAHPTHDGVAPTASDASQQDARSASVDSLEAAQNLRWA